MNKIYPTGTVPVDKNYPTGTVPLNKNYPTGTVPVNNKKEPAKAGKILLSINSNKRSK